MTKSPSLFPLIKEEIGFDALWQQTRAMSQALGGALWSETGDQDPGLTLLQAACYNVSDLSYRLSLPLDDLLTRAQADSLFPAAFGPQQALTCAPVTFDDRRQVLLDLHSRDLGITEPDQPGFFLFSAVYLAQSTPSEQWYDVDQRKYGLKPPAADQTERYQRLEIRAGYRVAVVPSRGAEALGEERLRALLRDSLAGNRNLGEHLAGIDLCMPTDTRPRLTVELESDVSHPAAIAAAIYRKMQQQVLAEPQRVSLAERQQRGEAAEAIWQGPQVRHGWIRDRATGTAPQQLNLSALFSELLAIEGVAAVTDFALPAESNPGLSAVPGESWLWTLPAGHYPRLWGSDPIALLCQPDILRMVAKGGITVTVDEAAVRAALQPQAVETTDVTALPAGRLRDAARYTPIGERLPACYRTREPAEAADGSLRRLHQFLLPAEQLLADGCASVAALPDQLAFCGRGNQVSAGQWPFAADSASQQVHRQYAARLNQQQQTRREIFPDNGATPDAHNLNRELATLDYLLGYFGQQRAARPLTLDMQDFLASQRGWLSQQTALGYARSTLPPNGLAPLQKRLAARVGLGGECFAERPALDQLPFYLIDHRQLLADSPAAADFSEYPVSAFAATAEQLEIQRDAPTPCQVNALVDLIAVEGENRLIVRCQLVTASTGGRLTLSLGNSQQLVQHLPRLEAAFHAGQLTCCHSDVWLEGMDFPLNYASHADTTPADQRWLSSSDRSPFPALARIGDKITLTGRRLPGVAPATRDGRGAFALNATIIELDPLSGTLLIEKDADGADFPPSEQAADYEWHFAGASQAKEDRFSYVLSIAIPRRLLAASPNSDSAQLTQWLQQTILAEMPAHVSLLFHWLSDSEFANLGRTYQRWMQQGNPLNDDGYSLLRTLTLGHLPANRLGIGTLHIASAAQRTEVMGENGDQWHEDVIVRDQLFHLLPDDAALISE